MSRARLAGLALGAVALVPGCAEDAAETFSVYGYLYTGPVVDGTSTVLPGATVNGYDLEGNLLGEGYEPNSSAPGYYRVPGFPPGADGAIVASAAGSWVPTVVVGRIPEATVYLDPGELYIFALADVRTYLEAWERSDPGGPVQDLDFEAEGNGGFVVGQLADAEVWAGTRVGAVDAEGGAHEAAYFAETGLPDRTLTATTADGRFALFGLPAGPVEVWITLPGQADPLPDPFRTLVVEDGVTSLLGFRIALESP